MAVWKFELTCHAVFVQGSNVPKKWDPCGKNDVYSYGVVLMELITGCHAIQQKLSLLE
jgi:hypothetical protein